MVIFLSQKRIEAEDLPPVLTYNSAPNARYLWNEYLTSPVGQLGQDWILPVIHGFVDQGNVSIYGSPVLLTLIARRSNRYAGTRYEWCIECFLFCHFFDGRHLRRPSLKVNCKVIGDYPVCVWKIPEAWSQLQRRRGEWSRDWTDLGWRRRDEPVGPRTNLILCTSQGVGAGTLEPGLVINKISLVTCWFSIGKIVTLFSVLYFSYYY